jgi:hypothetical protein
MRSFAFDEEVWLRHCDGGLEKKMQLHSSTTAIVKGEERNESKLSLSFPLSYWVLVFVNLLVAKSRCC